MDLPIHHILVYTCTSVLKAKIYYFAFAADLHYNLCLKRVSIPAYLYLALTFDTNV